VKYEIVVYDDSGYEDYTLGIYFNKEWLYHEDVNKFLSFINASVSYHDIVRDNNGYREFDEENGFYYWFKSEQDCINAYQMIVKLI
jgi:hypothetical protein